MQPWSYGLIDVYATNVKNDYDNMKIVYTSVSGKTVQLWGLMGSGFS